MGLLIRQRLLTSVLIVLVAVVALATGNWPVTLLLLVLLVRRHVIQTLWLRRLLGHRWSAALFTLLTLGFVGWPLYILFEGADASGRTWIVIATAAVIALTYGLMLFLLRSLAGEYDRSPAKTDIRPPK